MSKYSLSSSASGYSDLRAVPDPNPKDVNDMEPVVKELTHLGFSPEDIYRRALQSGHSSSVVGDEPPSDRIFSIVIEANESVILLKEAIKDEIPRFRDIDILRLWKVSIPADDLDETLEHFKPCNKKDVQKLLPLKLLSGYCSDSWPAPEHLHIVVESPNDANTYPPYKEVTRRYRNTEKGLVKPPSTFAVPKEFHELQKYNNPVFSFNRPRAAATTIPITLLHPVFGEFVDDCTKHEPIEANNMFAWELSQVMSGFYDNGGLRNRKFQEILATHGISFGSTIEGTSCITNGDLRWGKYCYLISEVKNELAGNPADPLFQASLRYIDSMAPQVRVDSSARLPCILIYVAGTYIGFAGAIYTDHANVQVLSPFLSLFIHDTDIEKRTMIARHLGALKNAICSLKSYYEHDLPETPQPDPDNQQIYPYQNDYMPLDGLAKCLFKYVRPIWGTLVFVGMTNGEEEVFVKFVRRYSTEAHLHCASRGFAPTLRAFNKLPGGWYMVVMDSLRTDYYPWRDATPTAEQLEEIRANVASLHQVGFVHGDIHDANVTVSKTRGAPFMLIDFDWAGKIWDVRYPINVNHGPDLWRPEGAQDGMLITTEHDINMLDYLLEGKELLANRA